MSVLEKDKENRTQATEELTTEENNSREELSSETLTLEDLELDISEPSMTFTATLHFEFSDIFNAVEHIEQEPIETAEEVEPTEEETEVDAPEKEPETEVEPEESAPESENSESEPEVFETEPDPLTAPVKPHENLMSRLKKQDAGTKKLVMTVCILFVIIAASIIAGLAAANSLVDDAKTANKQKAEEMQANIKEVKLADSIYDIAADKVIEDVAVPTYTLDQLYALDLREKTGFTAEDLKVITRKGLVGCEEAFVKAEEAYGVNSIFLVSIASLESAHGTMMFRPNNMFGYGRTGFSSKEECIMTVAKGLGTRYLPPGGSLYGGSPTLKGVNKRYAANPQWYYKVGKYMQGYYAELAAEKNGALDKFE